MRIVHLTKGIVAICVADSQYGMKLFDYINENFSNECEYIIFDSITSIIDNGNWSTTLVVDEDNFKDIYNQISKINTDNMRIAVLTETKDVKNEISNIGSGQVKASFIHKYQAARNICTEIIEN